MSDPADSRASGIRRGWVVHPADAARTAGREPAADRAGRAGVWRRASTSLTGETGAGKTLLAHALDLLLGGRAAERDRPRRGRRGLCRGRVLAPSGVGRGRRAVPTGARGARARAARVARRPDPGVRVRQVRDGRRSAGAGQRAALVLRSARAPQADARGGPARRRSTPTAAAEQQAPARARGRARMRGSASSSERERGAARAGRRRASASSTCSAFELDEIESVAPERG